MRKTITEGPARYALIGIGALAALIFLAWRFWPRPAPPPIIVSGTLPPANGAAPAPVGTSDAPPRARHRKALPIDAAPSGDQTAGAKIMVDVEGAVKHPKVYPLASGTRIFQALNIAGGITADADISSVNQAAILSDGDQVLVLTKEQNAAHTRKKSAHPRLGRRKSKASSKTPPKILTGTININTASLEQLERIPGVGAVTAQSILDERQKIGSFHDSSDLMEIDGMTPRKYEKMRPYISIF